MNSLFTKIKSILKPVYNVLSWIKSQILESLNSILGKRNPLIPPRHLIFIGDGDYENTGKEFLHYFVKLAGLKPDDKVLDIGCGIGRMAVPLTSVHPQKVNILEFQ